MSLPAAEAAATTLQPHPHAWVFLDLPDPTSSIFSPTGRYPQHTACFHSWEHSESLKVYGKLFNSCTTTNKAKKTTTKHSEVLRGAKYAVSRGLIFAGQS